MPHKSSFLKKLKRMGTGLEKLEKEIRGEKEFPAEVKNAFAGRIDRMRRVKTLLEKYEKTGGKISESESAELIAFMRS